MNVALTRAKAALIVVGQLEVLQTDVNWNRFLYFCCVENSCYTGIHYFWSPWRPPSGNNDDNAGRAQHDV